MLTGVQASVLDQLGIRHRFFIFYFLHSLFHPGPDPYRVQVAVWVLWRVHSPTGTGDFSLTCHLDPQLLMATCHLCLPHLSTISQAGEQMLWVVQSMAER